MTKITKFILVLIALSTFACAKDKKEIKSDKHDYIKAMKQLKEKDYLGAAENFEKIGDEYPLSKWGVKAKIMAAYGFYKEQQYEDVARITEDFKRDNPSNPNFAYMQYLQAISYYDQMNNIKRSQDNAKLASSSFRELIARFPRSDYSTDGREKLILVEEHIAGGRMSVGRYQMRVNNYIGAVKNFQNVIYNYSRTKQAAEAYFRLYEIHYKLGLDNVADIYLEELNQLYPDNGWNDSIDI